MCLTFWEDVLARRLAFDGYGLMLRSKWPGLVLAKKWR